MSDSTLFVQTQKTALSGSGCTSTATSVVLASLKLPDGSTNVVTANIGDKGFGTLEPGTSREEHISFTGITQNANGTATLTGVTRGLRFVAPYDEVAGNKKSHAGGAVFVMSNTAAFYNELSSKDNDETITGKWTYSTVPESTAAPVTDDDLTNKAYVDALALGGSPTVDKVVVAGNAGENVAAGNLLYFDVTDKEWKKTDADNVAMTEGVKLGIAQGTGTNGNAISGGVLVSGVDANQTGMTPGVLMYVSNTAGAIASSAGTISKVIGIAKSATELYFDPTFFNNIRASETAAGYSEEATDAEVTDGTATGATGAKLFVTPAKLATRLGTITAKTVRTYLNAASPATWTKPAGLKYVVVEVQGGGGGGAGADSDDTTHYASGGNAGAYSKKQIAAASLGSTETITIGAGGGGGTTQGAPTGGSDGGASSFGSHCSANGGKAGQNALMTSSGFTTLVRATATGGDLNVSGDVIYPATAITEAIRMRGANSKIGYGGSPSRLETGSLAALAAGYGAGGCGGARKSTDSLNGSSGGAGIVIVTEYYI